MLLLRAFALRQALLDALEDEAKRSAYQADQQPGQRISKACADILHQGHYNICCLQAQADEVAPSTERCQLLQDATVSDLRQGKCCCARSSQGPQAVKAKLSMTTGETKSCGRGLVKHGSGGPLLAVLAPSAAAAARFLPGPTGSACPHTWQRLSGMPGPSSAAEPPADHMQAAVRTEGWLQGRQGIKCQLPCAGRGSRLPAGFCGKTRNVSEDEGRDAEKCLQGVELEAGCHLDERARGW